MASSLNQKLSKRDGMVVDDTGDFQLMAKYKLTYATTNPSLILQATHKPDTQHFMDQVIKLGERNLDSPP